MSSELAEYFLSLLIPFSVQLSFPRGEILGPRSLPTHAILFPLVSEVF